MQSTDSLKPTEFWWPNPDAFDDLTVEDTEEGFTLEAPDDTECGEWLAYWNQTPDHIECFTEAFTKCLQNHIDTTLEENGQTQELFDEQHRDPEQAENVGAGSQP
jgi:hypothetical protein